jgi:hypothetical protein
MKKILFLLFIVLTGCTHPGGKQAETKPKPHTISWKKFQGNWLIKDYFDKIYSGVYVGSLSTAGYGLTEIRIDSAHRDSAWLFNEDDYAIRVPLKVIGNDSLLVRMNPVDSSCIYFNDKAGTLEVRSCDHIRKFGYYRVPDSLLSGTSPKSAFRKALNCAISRTSFVVYDPRLDQPHGTDASLDCDGNVHGLKNFRTFRIYVNAVLSNCRDVDRIDFSDGRKTYSFGLALVKNGIFLYHLKSMGKNTGKPYYMKGDFYLEMDRPVKKSQGKLT